MSHVYIATLGQRPEAITVAFDELHRRYSFAEIAIMHTEPNFSGIADAIRSLDKDLRCCYPQIPVRYCEILRGDGSGLIDIENDTTARDYYWGVINTLLHYKQQHMTVHLMIAGGRKAMSVYAAMAAPLLLDGHDRVWTVLTPVEMIRPGAFHVDPGFADQVQLVSLPFQPSTMIFTGSTTMSIEQIRQHVTARSNHKSHLLSKLSPAQRRIADTLDQHPDATAADLARLLTLSIRTVNRHFEDIFDVMQTLFEYGDKLKHPKNELLRILREK